LMCQLSRSRGQYGCSAPVWHCWPGSGASPPEREKFRRIDEPGLAPGFSCLANVRFWPIVDTPATPTSNASSPRRAMRCRYMSQPVHVFRALASKRNVQRRIVIGVHHATEPTAIFRRLWARTAGQHSDLGIAASAQGIGVQGCHPGDLERDGCRDQPGPGSTPACTH
jgi:hypothetical protein